MKKLGLLSLGLCVALAFTSCKSSESAYKKAYEKAKQQELAESQNTQEEAPAVDPVPVVTAPVETAPVTTAPVREEKVELVAGDGLKAYSVVCGSFSLKANAEGLQKTLSNAGYNAQIAYNEAKNMYRVVASTYDDKAAAVQSRNTLRGTYPDAWLLLSK